MYDVEYKHLISEDGIAMPADLAALFGSDRLRR
jgi:hypothetical protein